MKQELQEKINSIVAKSKKYVDNTLINKYTDLSSFKETIMLKESAKVDVNAMLNFLAQNKDLINEFAVHDAYAQAITKKFRNEFDLYLSTDRFEIETIKFKASSTWISYEDLVKEYKEFSAKSGISSDDQKLKQTFEYALRYARFDGSSTISNFDNTYLSMIFKLLYYIKTGKLETKDNAIGVDIETDMKATTDYNYWSNKAFRNYTNKLLPGYYMSYLKNGKFIIKGLSNQDIEKLKHVFELYGRKF